MCIGIYDLSRSDKIQFLNSNHWTLYSVGRLWCLKWNDCPIYTVGQKSGIKGSVGDSPKLHFGNELNWGKSFSNWSFNFINGTKVRATSLSSILQKLHYMTKNGANSFSSRLSNLQCGTKIEQNRFISRFLHKNWGIKL